MVRIFDRLIRRALRLRPDMEGEFAEKRDSLENLGEHVLRDMEFIDAKSSALLTHVSLFIAVIVFLIEQNGAKNWLEANWFNKVLFVEAIFYTSLAMLLLRCVDIMGPKFRAVSLTREELVKEYENEILLRRTLYQFVLRMVFLLTAVLIIIIFMKYILGLS